MHPDEFRAIALLLPGAEAGAHMGHPDFRIFGKVFATLWPDEDRAVVKLTPEEQEIRTDRGLGTSRLDEPRSDHGEGGNRSKRSAGRLAQCSAP